MGLALILIWSWWSGSDPCQKLWSVWSVVADPNNWTIRETTVQQSSEKPKAQVWKLTDLEEIWGMFSLMTGKWVYWKIGSVISFHWMKQVSRISDLILQICDSCLFVDQQCYNLWLCLVLWNTKGQDVTNQTENFLKSKKQNKKNPTRHKKRNKGGTIK